VAVGRRHGLDLSVARPKPASEVLSGTELVIAVCDRAYEDLGGGSSHWSVPDPAGARGADAFEIAYAEIGGRIRNLVATFVVCSDADCREPAPVNGPLATAVPA
jgi:ArsR family transcriptional regulator, arsenate/arsenite/antimonite-responsive transcriptional repressor / arsenate reductase (thioredoxin)